MNVSLDPQTSVSIEHPGYMVTYHPMPDGYELGDWFHMIKCLHTGKGRVLKDTLFACEYHDDGPYPLKSRVKTKGVEAIWRSL